MSTTVQIAQAWDSAIWQHSDILAFTASIYNFEVLETSQVDINKLRYNQQINFIIYEVTRSPLQLQITKARNYNYRVRVTVVREYDSDGINLKKIHETLEKIDELVNSELSQTWGGTVTQMLEPSEFPDIQEIQIESKRCFRAQVVYQAAKHFVA